MESKTVFVVGEKEYNVVKVGIGQAQQVADLSKWLSRYGSEMAKALISHNDSFTAESVMEVIASLMGVIDTQGVLNLFILVFGCTKREAEEYFDVSLLLEGATALAENQPAIKRIADRFFSERTSTPPMEESSTL